MGAIKEAGGAFNIFNEIIFHEARREYRFKGVNRPIIGINGAGATGWPLKGQRGFMTENNCSGVLLSLDYKNTPIDMCLRRLDKEIVRYKNATLVGHSAGGLLALEWARINGWDKINKIITIATPLNGSPKVFGFAGQIVAETTYGSNKLNAILEMNPPKDKVISIFAGEDPFIQEPEKLKLNWEKRIKFDVKTHQQLQYDVKSYEDELKEAIGMQNKFVF